MFALRFEGETSTSYLGKCVSLGHLATIGHPPYLHHVEELERPEGDVRRGKRHRKIQPDVTKRKKHATEMKATETTIIVIGTIDNTMSTRTLIETSKKKPGDEKGRHKRRRERVTSHNIRRQAPER